MPCVLVCFTIIDSESATFSFSGVLIYFLKSYNVNNSNTKRKYTCSTKCNVYYTSKGLILTVMHFLCY